MKKKSLIILSILVCIGGFYAWKLAPIQEKEEHEKEGEDKMAPYEYFEMVRNYPDFSLDAKAFNKALQECYADIRKQSKTNHFDGAWTQEGPTNIGGRIVCTAVHPTNNNIIFAASAYGGIFKSVDGGNSWRPVFDSIAYLSIGCITIDQTNPNVMYAGTGDPSLGGTSFTGNGIYKSTDGGETWNYLGLAQTGVVAKITIDPTNSQILFASTMGFLMRRDNNKGLYKSIDGGVTWNNVLFLDNETGSMNVVINSVNPQIIYATMMRRVRTNQESIVYGNTTGIYKSIDGGDTWGELTNNLPPKPWCKVNIELDPTNTNTLLASIVNQNLQLEGIYKSVNAGSAWQQLNTTEVDTDALGGFGWYFGEVRVNPYNTNHILLQGVNLWESLDGGDTWGLGAPEWYYYDVHADKHFIHFFGAFNYMLSTDGGVYRTNDGGINWVKKNNFPITQFYHVKVSPWATGMYYGGAQDQGTSRGNASMMNSWSRVLGGDGFRTAFSNTDPEIIWASVQNGRIYYSTESGYNFALATQGVDDEDRKNWDSPYLLSKYNRSAYLGTQYVYKADDYGFPFFQKISPDLTDGNIYGAAFHTISALVEHEANPAYLFAGTSDGNVWRSEDQGMTWLNSTSTLPERYVTSLATSYIDSNLVYVTHSGYKYDERIPHIHRSKDHGLTWENISGDLPSFAINDVITFRKNDSILAVATDGGVYITTDAGTNWSRMGNNMPVFPVFDMDYDSVQYKLIAATHARSIMSYDLSALLKDVNNPDGLPDESILAQIKMFPNPTTDFLNIELPAQYNYNRMAIVNAAGQRVYSTQSVGVSQQIQTSNWNTGVYFVLVYINGMEKPFVKKITKST